MARKKVPGSTLMKKSGITFPGDEQWFKGFKEKLDQHSSSPSKLFQKCARDFMADKYINLDTLSPEVQRAFFKRAAELRMTNMQTALDYILREWMLAGEKKK